PMTQKTGSNNGAVECNRIAAKREDTVDWRHGMDRRWHRARSAAAWRVLGHRRAFDPQPWAPSRPCAWWGRITDASAVATREFGQRAVAGAARRAPRHL